MPGCSFWVLTINFPLIKTSRHRSTHTVFNMNKSFLIAFNPQTEETTSLKSETTRVTPATPPVPTQTKPGGRLMPSLVAAYLWGAHGSILPPQKLSSGMSAGLGDKREAARLLLGRQAKPCSTTVIQVSF